MTAVDVGTAVMLRSILQKHGTYHFPQSSGLSAEQRADEKFLHGIVPIATTHIFLSISRKRYTPERYTLYRMCIRGNEACVSYRVR